MASKRPKEDTTYVLGNKLVYVKDVRPALMTWGWIAVADDLSTGKEIHLNGMEHTLYVYPEVGQQYLLDSELIEVTDVDVISTEVLAPGDVLTYIGSGIEVNTGKSITFNNNSYLEVIEN